MQIKRPAACGAFVFWPWAPGAPFSVVDEVNVLSSDSTCKCQWSGEIDILDPTCDTEIDA